MGRAVEPAERGPSPPLKPPLGPGCWKPPRARLCCHGDHSPALPGQARLKFPDPLSLWRTGVPGRPRGQACHSAIPGLLGSLKAPGLPEPPDRTLLPLGRAPPLSGHLDLGRAAEFQYPGI